MNKQLFDVFSTKFAQDIFLQKYSLDQQEKWEDTCKRVVSAIGGQLLDNKEKEQIFDDMLNRRFIPGGRYIYSAGRPYHQVNNCFLFRAEDSRESWAETMQKATAALMTGGGIGFDYSKLRAEGEKIGRTGGTSTGPLALMAMVNEAGRYIMQGGQRRCLPEGTRVQTTKGLTPIEKVEIGTEVLTTSGLRKVAGKINQGEQKTVKIKTQNGELICTPNHRVAVVTSIYGEYKWVEAQHLTEGDRLYFGNNLVEGSNTDLPENDFVISDKAHTLKRITIPKLDSEIAWLIGLIHGDGYVMLKNDNDSGSKRHGRVQIACSKDFPEIKNKAVNVLSRFGTNVQVKEGDGDLWNVTTASVELAYYFSKFKKPKTELEVPEFITNGKPEIRAAYIAGLMDADGSESSRPIIIAAQVYPNYLKQVQELCSSLGIATRLKLSRKESGNWKNLYQLTVSTGKQLKRFKSIIGEFGHKCNFKIPEDTQQFSYSLPNNITNESGKFKHRSLGINTSIERIEKEIGNLPYTPVKVIDVVEHEILPTWDIEVEDKTEFFVNGYLVHNSAIWAGLNWSHKDVFKFMSLKNYSDEIKKIKENNFNFPAPMELTNISVIYDTEFFIAMENEQHPKHELAKEVWIKNCHQAFQTAEPGMSFNFRKDNESLRNACVTGETEILTDDGYVRIDSVVDTEVNVWNGFEFSKVTPKITGKNKEIVSVVLSNGNVLNCTENHRFEIAIGYTGKSQSVLAKNLEPGMKLIKHEYPVIEHGPELEDAYTQGFVAAEGMELNRTLYVYKPKEACLNRLENIKLSSWEENNKRFRLTLKNTPVSKNFVPIQYNLKSKLNWLAGLLDGDGCELKEGGCQLSSINRQFLLDLQKLLTTVGVQSKVLNGVPAGFRTLPDHKGGSKDFYCQESFRICIGAIQMQKLKKLGLKCERMSFDKTPQRDASQFVTVVDVIESGVAETVYCFNEPKRHLGTFNGIVTGQCTEVVSEDDSDKCNLGTVWMNRCKDRKEFARVVKNATKFLLCGGIYSDVPTEKIKEIGNKNNRIGLGLGGIHEWLMLRGESYNVTPELHKWLSVYEQESDAAAFIGAKQLNVSVPKGIRAVAPTGTIGIIAETTTGIEPLFCKAYKRRYFKEGKWLSQYVVDGAVKRLMDNGVKLEQIQDSYDLSFKQRVKFQADVQNYVDMAISSTCNMPAWGSVDNNENTVSKNAVTLLKYAKRLRGFTVYPDGCRGGQPLTRVELKEALENEGQVFEENMNECLNGVCGI